MIQHPGHIVVSGWFFSSLKTGWAAPRRSRIRPITLQSKNEEPLHASSDARTGEPALLLLKCHQRRRDGHKQDISLKATSTSSASSWVTAAASWLLTCWYSQR